MSSAGRTMIHMIHADRPDGYYFAEALDWIKKDGGFVLATPRLGEDLVVCVENPHASPLRAAFYNLGRVVSVKFFDDQGRKFVVRTNRMHVRLTILVELAEGITNPRI